MPDPLPVNTRAHGLGHRPGDGQMVVLHQHGVVQPEAVVRATTGPHGGTFPGLSRPGVVLRVHTTAAPGAPNGLHHGGGLRGDAGQPDRAGSRRCARRSAARRPGRTPSHHVSGLDRHAVARSTRKATDESYSEKCSSGHLDTGQHAGTASPDRSLCPRVGIDRLGRQVASTAEIFFEGRSQHVLVGEGWGDVSGNADSPTSVDLWSTSCRPGPRRGAPGSALRTPPPRSARPRA